MADARTVPGVLGGWRLETVFTACRGAALECDPGEAVFL